ncbi:MAG TPA: sigma-54 dependent transcriptional regulator [Haliangiales bacterium]|nr:sigma-54 dependent transcriptional regulator [Haliangiales bacterium]
MNGRVLFVDDDPDARALLAGGLGRRGYEIVPCGSAAEALERLRGEEVDVVLTDVKLGGMTGIELAQKVAESHPELPVVVITAFGNMEMVVEAMRAGAYDFITKPFSADSADIALARAIQHRRLTSEVRRLRQALSGRDAAILGDSAAMRRVRELIEQVAGADATVLITGESGTGKELVARAIHELGPRAEAPFVAINCAAIPASLLESELFGHVKGAFTDAKGQKRGLFVQASSGTLFLDEIGEMPAEVQVKLLRVLQERRVRPVGGEEEVPFDARLIAATNRDLETEVEDGRFRPDLYYRINVVHIEVPPLRSRQGDILVMAQHFLRRHAERSRKDVVGISRPAAQKLLDYDWPGNVRELENCLERAVALTRMSEIGVDDLPERVREHQSKKLEVSDNPEEMITLEEMERRYVRRVLAACGGNKTQAAKTLGLDRRTLYRRLESLGIGKEEA